MTDKPQAVIDAMDTSAYFNMMAQLMGVAAGGCADRGADGPDRAGAGPAVRPRQARPGDAGGTQGCAQEGLRADLRPAGHEWHQENGWTIPAAAGAYGTDYLARALIAAFGWPANLPEDAVYPYAATDGAGQGSTARTSTR